MVSTSSTNMQSLGEIEQRAPAVVVFVCFFVCHQRSESASLFLREGHLNKYYVTVYGSILTLFSTFFDKVLPFQRTRQFAFLSLGGGIIFAQIYLKIILVLVSLILQQNLYCVRYMATLFRGLREQLRQRY